MKTTKHILIAVIGVIAAVSTACEEDNALHPWGENTLVGDLGAVTVLTTEGTPGGAVITYRLPESKDLLYVKALYTVGESTPMEVRTSRYDHSVTLQGFGDTQPREVTLLCVDKMENEGPAVTTSVTPLTPPITSVYNSLNIGTTFGGIYIDYINADKGNIAIHVQTLDEETTLMNPPYITPVRIVAVSSSAASRPRPVHSTFTLRTVGGTALKRSVKAIRPIRRVCSTSRNSLNSNWTTISLATLGAEVCPMHGTTTLHRRFSCTAPAAILSL